LTVERAYPRSSSTDRRVGGALRRRPDKRQTPVVRNIDSVDGNPAPNPPWSVRRMAFVGPPFLGRRLAYTTRSSSCRRRHPPSVHAQPAHALPMEDHLHRFPSNDRLNSDDPAQPGRGPPDSAAHHPPPMLGCPRCGGPTRQRSRPLDKLPTECHTATPGVIDATPKPSRDGAAASPPRFTTNPRPTPSTTNPPNAASGPSPDRRRRPTGPVTYAAALPRGPGFPIARAEPRSPGAGTAVSQPRR